MAIGKIGASGQIFADGRDLTSFLRKVMATMVMATVQDTHLRPAGFYHTYIAGLRGGQITYSGDLPSDATTRVAELADAVGSTRTPRVIAFYPYGAEVGNLALFGNSLRSNFSSPIVVDGLITYDGGFEITSGSPGVSPGQCLFTPNGAASVSAEVQVLTMTGATGARTITGPDGINTFSVTPGDLNSTVQAAARANADAELDAVTVQGSTTAYSSGASGVVTPAASAFTTSGTGTVAQLVDGTTASGGVSVAAGQNIRVDFGAAQATTKFTINTEAPGDPASSLTITGSATGVFGGEETFLANVASWDVFTQQDFTWASQSFRYYQVLAPVGNISTLQIHEIAITGTGAASGGTGSYTFTFPSSVDNVPQMTTNNADSVVTTTAQGGAALAYNYITTTGPGTGVLDVAAATTNGLIASLQVIDATGGGKTLTAKVQHSTDGTTWTDLFTFTALTDVGGQTHTVAAGTTINKHIRLNVSAITGTFIIAAAFSRR